MNKGLRTSVVVILLMPIVLLFGAVGGGVVMAFAMNSAMDYEKAAMNANIADVKATYEAQIERLEDELERCAEDSQ